MSNRLETAVVAAVAALSAACASAKRNPVLDKYPAGVNGRTTILYYDVHGRTVAELRTDMRRLGPKLDGTSFVGETRSPMRWSWRTESTGAGGCSVRNVTVSVNAQITLPRWTPPADTEPGLVAEWARFLNALEVHEAGHKDISAKAGREIIEQVRGLSGVCSMISTRANDIARAIVERASQEQRAYDAATRHGLTQGTAFGVDRSRGTRFVEADALTLPGGPRIGTVRGALPVPLDRAWAALPDAYAAIGLAVDAVDSSAHMMGDSVTVRGTASSVAASELLDCGTPSGVGSADSVTVSLFVTSRLEPGQQPSGAIMTNVVQAIARPASAAPVACRSRGVLERRLFEALLGRVTR